MKLATTSAVFEKDGQRYDGLARFDYNNREKPWVAYLTKDGEWYKFLGDFKTINDAWYEARQLLGIPLLDDILPRAEGDQTDGPMNKEEE
jgi:hypothetical protein